MQELLAHAINTLIYASLFMFAAAFVAGLPKVWAQSQARKSVPVQCKILVEAVPVEPQVLEPETSAIQLPGFTPIALLPAFIANANQPTFTAADTLVYAHAAYAAQYRACRPNNNVVAFIRSSISATVADLVTALQESVTATDASLDELKQTAWDEMSPYDLRKACQQAGIRWRNANGKNKHLSKNAMIAALKAKEAIAS